MLWLLLVLLLAVVFGMVLWLFSRRRAATSEPLAYWRLAVPRDAEFSLSQATAWFAALAPLLAPEGPAPWVELRGEGRDLALYLAAPASWEAPLRGQLAAWFPGARLEPADDANVTPTATVALELKKPPLYPLRIAEGEETDPLLGLLGILTEKDGCCGLRLTWSPPPREWKAWSEAALAAAELGNRLPPRGVWFWLFYGWQLLRAGSAEQRPKSDSPALQRAAAKVREPAFTVRLLVWASEEAQEACEQRVRELSAYLAAAFREPFGNALTAVENGKPPPGLVLSAREVAALFHLPAHGHPLVPGELTRRGLPPVALLTAQEPAVRLGEALTPEGPVPFGLRGEDRRLHLYVVGKTGTGKSTLLATLFRQDLAAGRGVGLIDPHGDLAERVLAWVPPERAEQLLYFNPADADYPVGFNLLAQATPASRPLVASGLVGIFKKLYGDSWGPRLEYFLRNTVLALLETPSPSLLALPRFLTDRAFRERLLPYVRDPLLRAFFTEEFVRYDPRWRAEALSPILNKVGQFLASPLVRHVVGQRRPGFDLRRLMDDGQIFIANLASGKIGEDNAALLGSLLVAGFQLAAMARADQPEETRRDFYLAVDEFQHFAGEAFSSILSEARKFHLCLTLSHQYLDQLPPDVSDAVFGNAGTLAAFRVGAGDTARLAKEFAPVFDTQDLVHLPNYRFSIRLTHRGEPLPPFSARTVPLPEQETDLAALIATSRRRWARPRAEVETEVGDLWEGRAC